MTKSEEWLLRTGTVALVTGTGTGTGIGRAAAITFAREAGKVVLGRER